MGMWELRKRDVLAWCGGVRDVVGDHGLWCRLLILRWSRAWI